jgi:hypothetical protein
MNAWPLLVPLSAPVIVLLVCRSPIRDLVLLIGLMITIRGTKGDARIQAYSGPPPEWWTR